MIPSLPSNIFNLVCGLGVFLVGFCFIQDSKYTKTIQDATRNLNVVIHDLNDNADDLDIERLNLLDIADEKAKKNNVPNPITETDTTLVFKQTLQGPPNLMSVSKQLEVPWRNYLSQKMKNQRLQKKMKYQEKFYEEDLKFVDQDRNLNFMITAIGMLLTFVGVVGLVDQQILKDRLLKREVEEKTDHLNCQSCFKRFNSTIQNGKFSDGAISLYYCTECFSNSEFMEPDLKIEDVMARYVSNITGSSSTANKQAKKIFPNLRRWKIGKY